MKRRMVWAAALVLVASQAPALPADSASPVHPGPVPRARCGPGSHPETGRQGRVSQQDVDSGRASKGFWCNAELIGRFGPESGGYRVHRYVDGAGRECAYYDSTLLFPSDILAQLEDLPGVYVLDMSDPRRPAKTTNLVTPAMLSPHESMSLNTKRGLLAAVMGNPLTGPGFLDIYDLSEDCRRPVLRSSTPVAILGHEGAFSPDGKTFYATSTAGLTMTAIDVSNPSLPVPLWVKREVVYHGLNISADGRRAYIADIGERGLTILDVSQIQERVTNPEVPVVSRLTWPEVSIPQTPIPVTIRGRPYLIEIDEFAGDPSPSSDPSARVGAARIIDISDERRPKVVSNIRLEVHMPRNRASQMNDPGADFSLQGYAGHYCAVPRRDEPGIVACSFIVSGMRVFDIRDPLRPREVAYFNAPRSEGLSNAAMSAPAFVPDRREIWYSDGSFGFFAVRLTNGAWPTDEP